MFYAHTKRCQILSTYKPAANFNQLEKAGNQLQFVACQILKKAAILNIIYIENERERKVSPHSLNIKNLTGAAALSGEGNKND